MVEELVHVSFIETNNLGGGDDDGTSTLSDVLKKMNFDDSNKDGKNLQSPQEQEMVNSNHDLFKGWRFVKNHPNEQIIGDASREV